MYHSCILPDNVSYAVLLRDPKMVRSYILRGVTGDTRKPQNSHKVALEVAPDGVVMLAVRVDLLSTGHADSTGHRNSRPYDLDIEKAPEDMSYRTAQKLHACRL